MFSNMHACDMYMYCVIYSNFSSFDSFMSQFSVHREMSLHESSRVAIVEFVSNFSFAIYMIYTYVCRIICYKYKEQNCPANRETTSCPAGHLKYVNSILCDISAPATGCFLN